MGMGGEYREVAALEHAVATEKFDQAWYPGEAIITVLLTEQDGSTTLTQSVTYQSAEARDGVLKSGMEGGVLRPAGEPTDDEARLGDSVRGGYCWAMSACSLFCGKSARTGILASKTKLKKPTIISSQLI
jgi:hypothetical protein